MSQKVVSWWKYNPLLQKPMSLDPVRPWGWYWYYGPDPASGCSYGQYHDEENDFDMISAKDKIVYSPATGKPMQFVGLVPEDEMNERTNKVTGDQATGCRVNCLSCQATLVSDYDLSEVDKVHCAKCGELCEIGQDKKTIKGEKTMTKEVAREQRIQGLKRKIRANILKKRKSESAKEKRSQLADEERKKRQEILAKRNALTQEQRKIKAEEEKKEEDDELISLDSIMEAMEEGEEGSEGGEESLEEDDALLDDKECDPEEEVCAEEEESFEGLDEEEEPAPVVEEPTTDDVVEEPMDETGGEEISEPSDEEGLDLDFGSDEEDLGEGGEGGEGDEGDEYYDLDMVLSMVNKKEKLARMKNKGTKKKVKAGEEKEVEPKEEEEESLLDDEGSEEEVEEAPAKKEEMEAMKFEPLASLDTLKNVRKEDIDMALYHEDSDNPTWNIMVAGVPTARVQLKKQSSPEEIRAVFCSEDYAKDLMIHCEKTGFIQTMNKVKADFWSNHTSNKRIAERFQKEASASFETERKKLLASFKQNFRSCISIVSAGMSKNFYPDMGNSLKEHLFTNLRTVGLPEQTSISVVEKSFAEGAAQYFDSLFEKAEEYMNLTPDSRKEIAAAISQGSSIKQESLEGMEPATLGDRVAQASMVPNAISGTPLKVTRDVLMDSNEYKAQLKSVWRK